MAANLHDPNNHVPPVSAADVWDDGEVTAPAREPCAVVLPHRRMPAAPGPATGRSAAGGPAGLRIDVQPVARNGGPPPERASVKEYGGEVVKLEQTVDEAPFQAAKVIPAMPLTRRDDPRDLHGEGQDWGKARHHPLRWLLAAGAGAAVLLVAALAAQELLLTTKKQVPAVPLELLEEVKIEEVKGFEMDGACEATARSMVAAYAKAKTAAEVLPLLRDAARLAPRLNREWQPWHAPASWQPAADAEWTVAEANGRGYGCLSGRRPDFALFRAYFVRDGQALRLDWEATAGLGDTSFATLRDGLGMGGMIRAYLTPENFYSQIFPETEYRSYQLLAPDREQVVWGYVKTDSAVADALLKVFESAASRGAAGVRQPLTLRLTAPPKGSQKNQWLIGEMLHIDWVCP